jgi:RimJ/RimL family protein N-acetyltransferase
MTDHQTWWNPATLSGPTLTLSPMRLHDAPDYLAALGSAEDSALVVQYLTFRPPADLAEARSIISAAVGDVARMPYVQRITETGELVGTTSFYEIDPVLRAIAIGHTWIARRFWRTGINTESKLIMMSRAFEGLGAERLVWHTDIRNTRSQAAIERLGAQREGVLRHHRIRPDGSWRDTVQYAMLREEWPQAKERLLAPRVS